MEGGGETQMRRRGNGRAGMGADRRSKKHREQGQANEADAGQEWNWNKREEGKRAGEQMMDVSRK